MYVLYTLHSKQIQESTEGYSRWKVWKKQTNLANVATVAASTNVTVNKRAAATQIQNGMPLEDPWTEVVLEIPAKVRQEMYILRIPSFKITK